MRDELVPEQFYGVDILCQNLLHTVRANREIDHIIVLMERIDVVQIGALDVGLKTHREAQRVVACDGFEIEVAGCQHAVVSRDERE